MVSDCPVSPAGAVNFETFDGPTPFSGWRALGYGSRWAFLRRFGYASSSGGSSFQADASAGAAPSLTSSSSESSAEGRVHASSAR